VADLERSAKMKVSPLFLVILLVTLSSRADTYSVPSQTATFSVSVALTKPQTPRIVPIPIKQPLPEYPVAMRESKVQGDVLVSITVGADGVLTNIKILKASLKEFSEPVLEAIKQWRFSPAKEDGKSVAMTLEYRITFALPDE
jgi:periplasmic protein TonB